MNWINAIILGIIEGLTEYLPVSSTGHLLLAQRLLGIPETAANNAFAIAIQFGAILAVLVLYKKRFAQIIDGIFRHNQAGRKLLVNLIAAFMPAAIIGLLFDNFIETHLFGLTTIAIAWFIGGLVIFRMSHITKHRPKTTIESLSWKQALLIGFIQCLAMIPGVSRSLATILGGLWTGLALGSAIEFSFLLGVVTLSAASLFKIVQYGPALISAYEPMGLVAGFLMSWITAMFAIKWMVGYLNRHPFTIFAWWRILLAIIVSVLVFLN